MPNLVIVESPTKAKTIQKFLGADFIVTSSYGHIRDLPTNKLGVDVTAQFEPTYVVPEKAEKVIRELKKLAKTTDAIYFATDPDREGEAIAWHLAFLLGIKEDKALRITFHEITKEAITDSLKNIERINMNLVNAQQARRVLDRLVGYELSPLLWKKIYYGLSAGRVQSVAVRLIVEREEEIKKFIPEEYWSIDGIFNTEKNETLEARLITAYGEKLDKMSIKDQASADKLLDNVTKATYRIGEIINKESRQNPYAPFTTSTLQQDANKKLGFSAKQTMMIAQHLYEGISINKKEAKGLITYMRTDSVQLSSSFITHACEFIKKQYGKEYATQGVHYANKSKNAQEAHEAIRPTDVSLTPEMIKKNLKPDEYELYNLIWRRAIASQMVPAIKDTTSIDVSSSEDQFVFRATGTVIKFLGFLTVYQDIINEKILPALSKNDPVTIREIQPHQHFTEPPARYTEASLVKQLEELGIGRPSTYAPTISTIIARKYVEKEGKALKPTETGTLVNSFLAKHFHDIVDYNFTAHFEQELDDVSTGSIEWHKVINEFYGPFKEKILVKDKEISKKDFSEQETDFVCEKCGKKMIMKFGRFGKFLACSGYPECTFTQELTKEGIPEPEETVEEPCPTCGAPMAVKRGRFGKFIACTEYPKCKTILKKEIGTGVQCHVCKQGEFIEKKSRFGKIFYSCNRYPDCKTAIWAKPINQLCSLCSSPLVKDDKERIRCSNKECSEYPIKKEKKEEK